MKKERASSVPVQKGPFKINEPTYKWTNQSERVRDRQEQITMNKARETMDFHTPKPY
jgi:hypothetical protein